MDWNEAGEANRKAVRRLVALLLALAGLAECAAGRSRSVRDLVLWILRPAEEIARDHVAGLTRTVFPPASTIPTGDDAMRLALGFRALAAALVALTAEAFASLRVAPPDAVRRAAHEVHEVLADVRGAAFGALESPDTS